MSFFKYVIAALFLCASFTDSYSQKKISRSDDVEVFTSKSTKRKAKQTIDGFEKVERDNYVIRLWSKTGGYEYVTYDRELKIVDDYVEQEGEEEDDKRPKKSRDREKEHKHSFAFDFGENSYEFKGIVEADEKLNVFTIAELDEDGNESDTPTELGRIEGDDFYKKVSNSYMTQRLSEDGEKLLLLYKLAERRDKNNEKVLRFRLMTFNLDMEQLMDEVVEFEDKRGRVLVGGEGWLTSSDRSAFRLRNDGSVHVWARVDKGRSQKKETRFDLLLYRFSDSGVVRSTVKNVNTNHWNSTFLDGEIVMLSTWGYKGYKFMGRWGPDPGQEGFLLARWSGEEGDKAKLSRIKFGAKHLSQNHPKKYATKLKKKEAKGKPVLAPYYSIDEIRVMANGSLFILGQERYTVTTHTKHSSYTRYYYNDIHAFNITLDGDVNWSYVIPKAQMTGGYGGGGGHTTKVIGSKVYTIFNDNFRNYEKGWTPFKKKPYRFSGIDNPVALVTFDMSDPGAKQKRQLLWKSRAAGGLFDPEKFYSDDGEDFGLLYIQAGKLKQRLLRLDFK